MQDPAPYNVLVPHGWWIDQNYVIESFTLPDSGSCTFKSQELTCVALWPGPSLCSLGKEGQVLGGSGQGAAGANGTLFLLSLARAYFAELLG